jgi:hypothetical protein
MSSKIFISYRRGDDPAYAGRLFDSLQNAFGSDRLFMDVDSIEPGMDFLRVLEEEVAQSDVLLAVIGSRWVDALDSKGKRRLDNPKDFVRVEIEAALNENKWVVPVLVGNAEMPDPEELPESLRMLARRHAVRIKHERFKADTSDLIERLRKLLDQPRPQAAPEQKPPSVKPESEPVSPEPVISSRRDEQLALPQPAASSTKGLFRRWSVAALILLGAGIGGVLWQKPDSVRPPADAPPPGAAVSKTANASGVVLPPADEPRKIRTLPVRDDPDLVAQPPAPKAPSAVPSPSSEQLAAVAQPKIADRVAQPAAPATLAAAAPVAIAPAITGGYLVQVASQRSEAEAQAAYRALQAKFPALLGPRASLIKRADLGDKGVYYRVTIGPFDTSDAAAQVCGDLKTAGGQCVVQKN